MKRNRAIALLVLFASSLACGRGLPAVDTAATITQIAANILATQTAMAPTSTSTLTPSITPSPTPTSTPTPSPAPTATLPPCEDPLGCVYLSAADPIHIAYLLAVSGAVAPLGEDSLGGIQIAIADRGDELLGHPLLLTGADSGCNVDDGVAGAQELIEDPTILGIIGTNCSSAATAAMPFISEAGLVMISPSNTSPRLTDPDQAWLPGYFRTIHNDRFQGIFAAIFAYEELGARTAATIEEESLYSVLLRESFVETFTSLGGTVVHQGFVVRAPTGPVPALDDIGPSAPDVLYFPIFEPEGPRVVQQVRSVPGLEDTLLIAADGLMANTFPENAGENAVGMYLTGPYVSGPAYDQLLGRWSDLLGGVPPSGFHAFAYDATNLLLDAIEHAAIVLDDGGLFIGRSAIRGALAAVEDYPGIAGTLTCSEFGDCGTLEALAVFTITTEEVLNGAWPPELFFRLSP